MNVCIEEWMKLMCYVVITLLCNGTRRTHGMANATSSENKEIKIHAQIQMNHSWGECNMTVGIVAGQRIQHKLVPL